MRHHPRGREGRYLLRTLAQPLMWLVLGLALGGAVLAYQVRRPYTLDIGSPGDEFYVRNFYAPVVDEPTGRTFRGASAYGYVVVPSVGGGAPYSVTLSLNPAQAGSTTTIILNGVTYLQQPLKPVWQRLTFAVDAAHPQALAARDLVVELRGPPAGGLLLDAVEIGALGAGFVVPALTPLAYGMALLLLVYLLAGRVRYLQHGPAHSRRAARPALAATLLLAGALDGGLALARLPLAALLGYALAAGLAAHLLLAPAWWAARRLAPEGRLLARLLWRPQPWLLVLLTLAGAVAAYQVRHAYDLDIGSPADQAYTLNFHDRALDPATGRSFRTSDAYGYVVLPGIGGSAPYSVTLTLSPETANTPLTLILNGATVLRERLPAGWQTVTAGVDAAHPSALDSRDLVVEIRASRSSGIQLDRVQVGAAGPGFVTPAYSQMADLAAAVLLIYLLLGRLLAPAPLSAPGGAAGATRVGRWVPLAGAALGAALLLGLLAAVHLPLTVAMPHLVTTGVLTYLLLIGAEALARRIAPEAGGGARVAGGLVAAAFLLRFGLMALPETVIIDMTYHMKWMHELLAGNVAALTDPHGGLNQPPREWQLAIIIPKSPLFYFVAAPLAWLPGDLETAIKALVCLLEASTVLGCYALLARFAPALGGWRAGLWAGFAYAANPLSFRALAYGILPTILAQWLSLAFFLLLLAWVWRVVSRQPSAVSRQPLPVGVSVAQGPPPLQPPTPVPHPSSPILQPLWWLGLLILLAAALIAFPTIAVFNTLVAGGLALAWLGARYRRVGGGVAALLAGAWVVAVGAYYGVYLVDLLTRTLPQLLSTPAAAAGGQAAAPAPSTVHWTGPLDLLAWTGGYLVTMLPLLTGLAGLAILWQVAWRTRPRLAGHALRPDGLLAGLSACWIAVLPIFLLVNYRFDMIGKHLYYTMVPLALGSGIFLWLLARRGGAVRLWAVVLAGTLTWTALAFWIERLVRASS